MSEQYVDKPLQQNVKYSRFCIKNQAIKLEQKPYRKKNNAKPRAKKNK